MGAESFYRLGGSTVNEIRYEAITDITKIYKAKEGWEEIREDPMGADVPNYPFDSI